MYCAVLLCGADLLVRNASPAVTRATVEFQMHRLLVRLHHGLMVRAGAGLSAWQDLRRDYLTTVRLVFGYCRYRSVFGRPTSTFAPFSLQCWSSVCSSLHSLHIHIHSFCVDLSLLTSCIHVFQYAFGFVTSIRFCRDSKHLLTFGLPGVSHTITKRHNTLFS